MVIHSGAGYCITLIGRNGIEPNADSNGEIAITSYDSNINDTSRDFDNIIDLYVTGGYFSPENESEPKTALNGYLSMINKFRKGYNIELFPLSVSDDVNYYTKLFTILDTYKYFAICSIQTRAGRLPAKVFDFQFMKSSANVLPIIASDYSQEYNVENGSLNISFTAKAKFL